jgi:hypothetical protein
MVDGGPGTVPPAGLDAWLVTDTRSELIAAIRRLAGAMQAVARAARRHRVKRLVFAHIGRPTLRALEAGLSPTFGEFATDRQVFVLARRAT